MVCFLQKERKKKQDGGGFAEKLSTINNSNSKQLNQATDSAPSFCSD